MAMARRSRAQALVRRLGLSDRTVKDLTIGFALVCAITTAMWVVEPAHLDSPAARGAIEMAITMGTLGAAALLFGHFRRTRDRRDLLLLIALGAVSLTDFVFSAIPAFADASSVAPGQGARMASNVVVAGAFAAAALVPSRAVSGQGPARAVFAALAGAGSVVAGWVIGPLVRTPAATGAVDKTGLAAASHHPVSLIVAVGTSQVLLVSAMAFVCRARRGEANGWLLAGAAILLSAARLQYMVLPSVAAGWVTPRDVMRLGAYALLLTVAMRQHARSRRQVGDAAVAAERQRIARDLHDGLAQDLAFITAQSQRRGSEFGPDHAVTIAARRALATSRGAITDLSCRDVAARGQQVREHPSQQRRIVPSTR